MMHVDKRRPLPEKPKEGNVKAKVGIFETIGKLPGYEAQAKALEPPEQGKDDGGAKGRAKTSKKQPPSLAGTIKPPQDDDKKKAEAKAPASVYDYAGLSTYFEDEQHAQDGLDLERDGIRMQENGGLFLEAINSKASDAYYDRAPAQPPTTKEEKLHVPATGRDVAQRWGIVSKQCIARGMVNWKVAKAELIDNKVSGAGKAFELLSKAGLLDKNAKPGLDTATYVKQAMKKDRREALRPFLGNPQMFDKWPDSELVQEIIVRVENAVLDAHAFPEEQSGREITVYIHPDLLKTSKAWSEFVSDLYADFEASGLPMLPIAVGDKAVAGGGVKSKGQTLGYFSYRNEANATDKQLGYYGFPHWAGGNAGKTNAAHQKMQLDKAKVTKPKQPKGSRSNKGQP